jgi:NAD(P)-dependent dehydrogenase (short-subunit alcohol dehydrogenase family)
MTGSLKVALVTGASRGIGAGITQRLLRDGYAVVGVDLDPPDFEPTGLFTFLQGSVSRRETAEQAVRSAIADFGRLDLTVCNAGYLQYQPFLDLADEVWQRHVDVDLTGVFLTAQVSARAMAQQGGGVILVVTSVSAESPSRTQGHYCSVKAGAQMLALSMAWELGPMGIRVNSIGPGWVDTRLTSDYLSTPALRAEVERGIPLGRVGTAEDIASTVAFLASDEASYITGAHVRIDGGLIIGKDKA